MMQVPSLPGIEPGGAIQRDWTPEERQVVIRGVLGRAVIAAEPLLCTCVFATMAVAALFIKDAPAPPLGAAGTPHPGDPSAAVYALASTGQFSLGELIAPVFALAAVAFAIYTVALMYLPLRALRKTFEPIYIVDGYVRYRGEHRESENGGMPTGHIAVLDHDRNELCEWPLRSLAITTRGAYPALVEFSPYGGVHRIDGHLTGALPKAFMPFGVGNFGHRATLPDDA